LKGEEGAEGGERPAAALLLGNRGEVGRLEEEEGADRWAPPVGDRVRERGREAGACGPAWAKSGRRGRNWAGVTGPRREKRKGKKKRGRWAGPRVKVR
jgi:hypothetical protein